MRVAPRSVIVVIAVSAMNLVERVGGGFDRRGAGDVADGAETHLRVSSIVSSCAGRREIGDRLQHGRSCRDHRGARGRSRSTAARAVSRSMYCQTSSSVQLLIGKTRMFSP